MADEIEFHLKTTGDPSGAEEVEKSIFKAEDAAKQASRQADVDIAKGKQAAAVQREQADALREIADGQQMLLAGELSKHLTTITNQLGQIGPEAELAFSGVQTFLNVFATTGNPIAASFALAGSAIGDVITAYRSAAAEAKELAKQEQEDVQNLAEFRRNYAAQLRAENIVAIYEGEARALNKQTDAVERQARINAAIRGAAAAVEDAFGGTSSSDLDRKIAEIDAKTETLRRLAEIEGTKATNADAYAQRVANTEGAEDPKAQQAAALAQQAKDSAEAAQAALDEYIIVSNTEKQALMAEAAKVQQGKTAEVLDFLTQQAESAKKTLEQAAKEQGEKFSNDGKAALQKVTELLEKDGITPDEVERLKNAIEQGRVAQLALNATTSEALGAMRNNVGELVLIMKASHGESVRLWEEIGRLKIQIQESGGR
ncbi:MAG: hypothetical protein EOP87_00915 [Verrucomicrobiaceae bacterium]|nr:MAG: hypothetical protein EOP87_00915 [Verrucomicrobiaceae bacterium]